jgi:hypothetical protein
LMRSCWGPALVGPQGAACAASQRNTDESAMSVPVLPGKPEAI